jgi:hypothetical protein
MLLTAGTSFSRQERELQEQHLVQNQITTLDFHTEEPEPCFLIVLYLHGQAQGWKPVKWHTPKPLKVAAIAYLE